MPKLLPPKSGHTEALDNCLRVFEQKLHFTNPSPLFVLLGTIAANYFKGNPVWLMLVGPPSCGKSLLLTATSKLPNFRYASQVKNVAAFITWDKDKGQGGLLSQIGRRGFLVLKDFTSILSLDRDNMKEVLGVMRECYDGRYDRLTGNAGGSNLTWRGKLCILAGCTDEIYSAMTFNQSMGERFIYYRYDDANERDVFQQALSALSKDGYDPEEQGAELADAIREIFDELELDWKAEKRDLDDRERSRLSNLVVIGTKLRTVYRRHSYKEDQIVAPPQSEQGARLAETLGNLYLGMELVGVSEEWRWRLIRKIALDSGPLLRSQCLKAIDGANSLGSQIDDKILANDLKVGRAIIRRTLEEMAFSNLIYTNEEKQWFIAENVKRILGW